MSHTSGACTSRRQHERVLAAPSPLNTAELAPHRKLLLFAAKPTCMPESRLGHPLNRVDTAYAAVAEAYPLELGRHPGLAQLQLLSEAGHNVSRPSKSQTQPASLPGLQVHMDGQRQLGTQINALGQLARHELPRPTGQQMSEHPGITLSASSSGIPEINLTWATFPLTPVCRS